MDPMVRKKLRNLMYKMTELPTLPTVVAKLIELVNNPKTSASTLSKLISSDQVLTARILKLANSAFYGFPRKIATVNLAIVVLGFNAVKDLALSVWVIDQFSGFAGNSFFDINAFWEHSIGCGVAGKMMARKFGYRVSGEAFVAGVLHDIGKVVLSQYLKREFEEINRLVHKRDILFLEAEMEVLGVTHAQLGGWLAERWGLPGQLVESITYHHEPHKAKKNPELTALVHFSDILCRRARVGYGGDWRIPSLWKGVPALLGLEEPFSDESFLSYQQELLAEIEKAETFIDIIKRGPDGSQTE